MQDILCEVSCNIEKEEKKKERDDDRETRISRELPPECRFAEGASRSRVRFQHVTRPCNTSARWRNLRERKEKERRKGIRRDDRREKTGLSQSGRNWFLFAGFRPFDNSRGRCTLVRRLSQPSEAEQRLHMKIPLWEKGREKAGGKKTEGGPLPCGHSRSHEQNFIGVHYFVFAFLPVNYGYFARPINCGRMLYLLAKKINKKYARTVTIDLKNGSTFAMER